MRFPRISVRIVMAACVVIAFDCMALRSVRSRPAEMILPFNLIVFGGLPMMNLLLAGLVPTSRGRGVSWPSRQGFQVGGVLALATFLGLALLRPGWILAAVEPIAAFLLDPLESISPPAWVEGVVLAISSALLVLPQLLLALAGGLVGWMLRSGGGGGTDVATSIEGLPSRRRPLVVLMALMILAAAPALAIEGALRWKIDPRIDRLSPGTAAVVDLSEMDSTGIWAYFPDRDILLGNGTRVDIVSDAWPSSIGAIDSWGDGPPVERRQVQFTVSDGRGEGRPTTLPRSHLRPAR